MHRILPRTSALIVPFGWQSMAVCICRSFEVSQRVLMLWCLVILRVRSIKFCLEERG